MIPRRHDLAHRPYDPLAAALGRPVSPQESLTEQTVVAHWPGLEEFTPSDQQRVWTSLQWAEHLEDPRLKHPFPASPPDGRAIFHLNFRLAPTERELTTPEWAEVAHRFAGAAGIEIPGKDQGARWIAVQAQPGRLDLIANLVHLDGSWHAPSADILRRLSDEARLIEQNLDLASPIRIGSASRPAIRTAPTASTQLASILTQLADEQAGPLAAVRGLIEHAAHRVTRQPGAVGTDTAHRLELLARRLHAIQQDLDSTVAHLVQPPITVAPPTTRRTTHRSP